MSILGKFNEESDKFFDSIIAYINNPSSDTKRLKDLYRTTKDIDLYSAYKYEEKDLSHYIEIMVELLEKAGLTQAKEFAQSVLQGEYSGDDGIYYDNKVAYAETLDFFNQAIEYEQPPNNDLTEKINTMLTEKRGLTKKQKELLKNMVNKYDIITIDDLIDKDYEAYIELENMNDFETLWQDAERFIGDYRFKRLEEGDNSSSEKVYNLYGKKPGDKYEELLLTEKPLSVCEKIKKVAAKDGWGEFRVSEVDLTTAPDFIQSIYIVPYDPRLKENKNPFSLTKDIDQSILVNIMGVIKSVDGPEVEGEIIKELYEKNKEYKEGGYAINNIIVTNTPTYSEYKLEIEVEIFVLNDKGEEYHAPGILLIVNIDADSWDIIIEEYKPFIKI